MKIFDEEEISKVAYKKCKDLKDKGILDEERYWNLIEDSLWAHVYCRDVKDREEVWKKITKSKWAKKYCKDVKNREEVRRYIR